MAALKLLVLELLVLAQYRLLVFYDVQSPVEVKGQAACIRCFYILSI